MQNSTLLDLVGVIVQAEPSPAMTPVVLAVAAGDVKTLVCKTAPTPKGPVGPVNDEPVGPVTPAPVGPVAPAPPAPPAAPVGPVAPGTE